MSDIVPEQDRNGVFGSLESFNRDTLEKKREGSVNDESATTSPPATTPRDDVAAAIDEVREQIHEEVPRAEDEEMALPPEMISDADRTNMEPSRLVRAYRRVRNLIDNRPRWLFWGKKSETSRHTRVKDKGPADLTIARVTARKKSKGRRILDKAFQIGIVALVAWEGGRAIKPDWVPPVPIVSVADIIWSRESAQAASATALDKSPVALSNVNEQLETTPKVVLDRLKGNDYDAKQLDLIYSAIWDKYHTGALGANLNTDLLYNTFKDNPALAKEIEARWYQIYAQHLLDSAQK